MGDNVDVFFRKIMEMRYALYFILLFPCCASGQYDEILADSSITWAAVFEMTLPANPLDGREKETRERAEMSVLKLQSDDQSLSFYEADHSFNRLLWKASENDKWKYFADAAMSKPLTFEEILDLIGKPDTIVTIDPETFEEKVQRVMDVHCCPQWYPLLKTRQILTYNHRTARFDIVPLAIALAEEDGNVFYWMKFPNYDNHSTHSLDSPDINWAVRYVTKSSSARIADFQVLKGGEISVMERLFRRVARDTIIEIYTYGNFEQPASPAERDRIFQIHTDTIETFNQKTYEEEIMIVSGGYRPEDIIDIQLFEEWFWDKQRQMPFVRLRAIAPRYITEGGFQRAIFYMKTSD